ncbi:MAG: hypothetical protein ACREFL_01750, partial [Stellaceae bacterium]
ADVGITRARRTLLRVIRDLRQGREPLPAFCGDLYKVRSIAVTLADDGTPFDEAAKDLIYV